MFLQLNSLQPNPFRDFAVDPIDGPIKEVEDRIAEENRLAQEKADKLKAEAEELKRKRKAAEVQRKKDEEKLKADRAGLGRAEALVIPPEVLDLLRFMCATWTQIDRWAYEHAGAEALAHYPVVQGTANQINLQRIGEQPHNTANLHNAVKWMRETAV